MNIKVDFDNIVVKEDKNDFNVKVLMLKGEKGDQGDGEPNVIDKIQVNGTDLPVTNKTVNVPVPIVDSTISSSSTNPVQNSVIYNALSNKVDTSALSNYYEVSEIDNLLNDKADISVVNKKIYHFNNVTEMKEYDLQEGDYAITKGYYLAGDGGSAEYIIKSSSDKYSEELDNDLVAEINASILYSRQVGISEENQDNTLKLQTFIDNSQFYKTAYFQGGTYNVYGSLTIPTSAKIYVGGPVVINDYSSNSVFINFVSSDVEDTMLKNGYHKQIITGNDVLYIINKTEDVKTCFNVGDSGYTINGIISNVNIRDYDTGIILNPQNLYWLSLKELTIYGGNIGIKLNSGNKTNSDELVNIENCCFTRLNCCLDIEKNFLFNIRNTAFDFNECVFYGNDYAEITCNTCHFEGVGNKAGEIGSGYNSFFGIMKAKDNNYDYNRTNLIINNSRIVGNTLIGFNKKLFKGSSLYLTLNNVILQYGDPYKNLLKGDNSFEDVFLTDADVRKVTIKNCRPLYNDIYPNLYDRDYNLVDAFLESDSTTEEKTVVSATQSSLLEDLVNYDLYGLGSSTTAGTKYQIATLSGDKKQIIITPPYNGAISCLGLITKKFFSIDKLDELVALAFSKSTLNNCMVRYDIIYYDGEKNILSTQNTANNAANSNVTDWFTSPYPITRPSTNNYTPLIPPKKAEYFKVQYFLRATNNANSKNPAYFTGFYLF